MPTMPYDYDQITPQLLQGAFPRRLADAYNVADVVVFCAQELQPAKHHPAAGKTAILLPYDDSSYIESVPLGALNKAADYCAAQIRKGRKVLSTCAMGRNRSGLLSALILTRLGMTPADAVKRVQQRRPNSLSNPAFVSLLLNDR